MTDEEAEQLRVKWHEVVTRGEEWYRKIQQKVETENPRGHFIAIEVVSGQFIVARERREVSREAKEKFPSGAYFYVRGIVDVCPDIQFVGYPVFEEYRYAW